jgi:DhnA family fructose-bisphosphate aldolase class Ia
MSVNPRMKRLFGCDGKCFQVALDHGVHNEWDLLSGDVVKAESFEDLDAYAQIIEAASGRPVLPRGGSRVSDEELLRRTCVLMQKGASGIVYGRNVFQHPRPECVARACKAIVHQGASVAGALAILGN